MSLLLSKSQTFVLFPILCYDSLTNINKCYDKAKIIVLLLVCEHKRYYLCSVIKERAPVGACEDKIDKKERITIMIIVLVVAACCLAVVEAVEVSNKVNFMK